MIKQVVFTEEEYAEIEHKEMRNHLIELQNTNEKFEKVVTHIFNYFFKESFFKEARLEVDLYWNFEG